VILEGDSEHTPPCANFAPPFLQLLPRSRCRTRRDCGGPPPPRPAGPGGGASCSLPPCRPRPCVAPFFHAVSIRKRFPGAVARCEGVRFGAGGNRTPTGSCSHSQASPRHAVLQPVPTGGCDRILERGELFDRGLCISGLFCRNAISRGSHQKCSLPLRRSLCCAELLRIGSAEPWTRCAS